METEWRWQDHPDIWLSDLCANGQCHRCRMKPAACSHPCHLQEANR